MISRQTKWILWSEIFLSWLVLLALLYYTYLDLVKTPYIGFNYSGTNGTVQTIYVASADVDLQVGDLLHKVGDMEFETWLSNLRAPLFPALAAGETLPLEVERAGQMLRLQWPAPGFNLEEFRSRVYNVWWMGYLFWLTGLATLLLVRPLDSKRSLFAAFFFLTAIWLVVGNTSRWGYGDSRVIYRVALCFSVPVLLHLHWLFPRPLGKLPSWLLWALYAVTVVVSALYWTPLISPGAAALLYAFALLGSLGLLLAHYIRQPEARPHVRLLFYSLLFAIVPIAVLSLAVAFHALSRSGTFALAALPLIPGAYFYSIYRFQLGGSEFRANRLIAVYLYLILLGTLLLVGAATLDRSLNFAENAVVWSSAIGLVAALVTLYGFPPFQRLVDRRLLAMPLPPVQLIETYLARITITLNEASLVHLLKDEVLPSLLIRESALLRIRNNEAATIYSTSDELTLAVVNDLISNLKEYPVYRVTGLHDLSARTWVRLGLALQVEGKIIGLWLLGRHDPDDLYSPVEIATLQTLARQTALALANIEQAAQLHALHQASIDRQEQEHMKMAHFLHDAILNQAAHLYMSLDATTLNPRVESAYTTLKDQIHQMVSNLRPPSLDLGLGAALEELAGELDQRTHSQDATRSHPAIAAAAARDAVADAGRKTEAVSTGSGSDDGPDDTSGTRFALSLHMPMADVHYPTQVENQIFRIVQQACENAFRHAHAQTIQISGTLEPNHIELTIEDDGVGFMLGKPLDITYLLAHKHFGLVHMMERAEHIGAELALESTPGQGTRVRLIWSGSERMDE